MKPLDLATEQEHEAALAKLQGMMDALPGSPEEAELELWAQLVERYEALHFPIDRPDPTEASPAHSASPVVKPRLCPYSGRDDAGRPWLE